MHTQRVSATPRKQQSSRRGGCAPLYPLTRPLPALFLCEHVLDQHKVMVCSLARRERQRRGWKDLQWQGAYYLAVAATVRSLADGHPFRPPALVMRRPRDSGRGRFQKCASRHSKFPLDESQKKLSPFERVSTKKLNGQSGQAQNVRFDPADLPMPRF